MKKILLIIAAVVLTGCAAQAQYKPNTPSGRPEVTIENTTKQQVVDLIVGGAMSGTGHVKSVSDHEVVIARRIEGSFGASLLYGSRYDINPEARVYANVVQSGQNVRVFARSEMVTNPGSAFERKTDVTDQTAKELQEGLEIVKSRIRPAAYLEKSSQAEAGGEQVKNNRQHGELSGSVERLARQNGCIPTKTAALIAKTTGIETYQVTCENGQQALFKCELRQCRMMN